jgi:hypothetical protein
LSLVEIEAFLGATASVRFVGCGRTEIYGWVDRLLCHHEYPLQKRRAKGLLRAYIDRMTGVTVHVPYRELVKRDGAGAPRRWQTTALPR